MAGSDLLNKPDLNVRVTAKCLDAAGAVEHLLYKWDDTTKKMTVCAVDDVVSGVAAISVAQNVDAPFDCGGIVLCVASGTVAKGAEVQAAADGKVKTLVAGKARAGKAFSHAGDGEKVSVLLTH